MKKISKTFFSYFILLLLALACSKYVGLVTEVEFEFLEEHISEGLVNQGVPTTFTIVPEEILEGYRNDISYEVLEGEGYFEDADGNIWDTETSNTLLVSGPLSSAVLYFGQSEGTHRLRVIAKDGFGFEQELEIGYFLEDVPVLWEAQSGVTEIELGESADISVQFEIIDTSLELDYEAKYELLSGSGTLLPSAAGGFTLDNEFAAIAPGSFLFVYTPGEIGPNSLVFTLRDSNGQELVEELNFTVVEIVPVRK